MNKPYIIGITGTYGKTSCAYSLHQYFKSLGYVSCLISSNYFDFPQENQYNSNVMNSSSQLRYYINLAKNAQFLVIEISEESLANNIYEGVDFDCKVLVSFDRSRSLHRNKDEYAALKINFFNDQDCLRVINKNIDLFEQFNTDGALIFSTELNDECDVYPISQKFKFHNASCTIKVLDDVISLQSKHGRTSHQNLITAIAVLTKLDMFDSDFFMEDFDQVINVPGRSEMHTYNNRHLVIDSGNGKALKTFMETTEDIDQYKVRGLLSAAGGIGTEKYNEMVSNGFVSLNIYLHTNPDVRRSCFVFGGYLYKAYHKLQDFPTHDICYTSVIDELGHDLDIDFSNREFNIPEGLYDALYETNELLGSTEIEKSYSYIKNIWWRSIYGLQHTFTVHYDKFLELYNNFLALNDKKLNQACAYMKQMIDYEVAQFRALADSVNNLPIQKFYLTMNNKSVGWNDELLLRRYKAFFTKEVDIFVSRQDAIQAMINDSNEEDILFIAGRGDALLFLEGEEFSEFTDAGYAKSIFEEVDVNES